MEERVRRAALHAVAKIALGTGWLALAGGCGGRIEFDSRVPGESGTPFGAGYGGGGAASQPSQGPVSDASTVMPEATSSEMVPDVDTNGDERLSCLSPIAIDASMSLVSDAELACCTTYVTAAHPLQVADGGVQDPALVNCCKAVIVRAAPSTVRYTCCYSSILGPPESLWGLSNGYCAPWGPPVPPDLDWSPEAAA